MSKAKHAQNSANENEVTSAPVETTAPAVEPTKPATPAEPTSEKLEALKAKHKQLRLESSKLLLDGKEVESENLNFEAYKVQEDIKKEIAEIKRHQLELAKKEKEAAVVKLLTDQNDLYLQVQQSIGNDKMTIDEKNEINNKWKAAYEVVVNRLLGSRPATGTATEKGTGAPKGATGSKIHDLILEKLGEGKSITDAKKEIKEMGYARGTVDTCATDMKKAGEIDY